MRPSAAAGDYNMWLSQHPEEGRGGPVGAERRRHRGEGEATEKRRLRCNTHLLLKHPDATLPTYVLRQMKHMKHTSETLPTILDLLLKHSDETLAIYVRNN
jgi:hypothetical protein